MRKEDFKVWLQNRYPGSRHVNDVVCRCERLEKLYGDLDITYNKNHCTAIAAEFVYSKDGERQHKTTGHGIAIHGSEYALTHDLLDALNRYVEFREENP